jgi:hypothetical protein
VASRRWYIDHRSELAAALRKKYRRNKKYRLAKIAAARRQTAALTTSKKGELAEHRCARRSLTRPSWLPWLDAGTSILNMHELESPTFIIERDGKRQRESWPPNDLAQFWLASSAAPSAAPLGCARFRREKSAPPAACKIGTRQPERTTRSPSGRRRLSLVPATLVSEIR